MRIVAGRHKGRRLTVPAGHSVRPTSDKARGALFDILRHGIGFDLDGAAVIDAFAGSGALGLEALSRGARAAVFMDRSAASLDSVRANCAALDENDRTVVIQGDARRPPPPPLVLQEAGSILLFLDPPYNEGLIVPSLAALRKKGWLMAGALCVAEMARDENIMFPADFLPVDERVYGAARLVFLRG